MHMPMLIVSNNHRHTGSTLVEAFDEGGVPYVYQPDTSRTLAYKYELLDTSTSNPSWMREPAAVDIDSAGRSHEPPMRADYPLGDQGRHDYRRDRAHRYLADTGSRLTGSVAQQADTWDDHTRPFRARSDLKVVQNTRDTSSASEATHNRAPQYFGD